MEAQELEVPPTPWLRSDSRLLPYLDQPELPLVTTLPITLQLSQSGLTPDSYHAGNLKAYGLRTPLLSSPQFWLLVYFLILNTHMPIIEN